MSSLKTTEVAEMFGIGAQKIHTFLAFSIPEELKPKLVYNSMAGGRLYMFNSKDIEVLEKAIKYKKEMSYNDIKEKLQREYCLKAKQKSENLYIRSKERNSQLEISEKVQSNPNKTKENKNIFEFEIDEKKGCSFIYINEMTIALPGGVTVGVANSKSKSGYSREIGKALAYYRMKGEK